MQRDFDAARFAVFIENNLPAVQESTVNFAATAQNLFACLENAPGVLADVSDAQADEAADYLQQAAVLLDGLIKFLPILERQYQSLGLQLAAAGLDLRGQALRAAQAQPKGRRVR